MSSQSRRANLIMPVARIKKFLKRGYYATRISADAGVYLAGALQYLVTEILELSCKAADDNNRSRINPRHILLAIRNDQELDEMLNDVMFSAAGVMPHIEAALLPRKLPKITNNNDMSSQEY